MSYFNIVAQTTENTVVTEYEPVKTHSDSYQSEAALEKEFIRLLCEQGYEYLPIHSEAELIANLRQKLGTPSGSPLPPPRRRKRPATALNLPPSGPTPTTGYSLI